MQQFINDIPVETARMAFYGTSYVPERRGDQYRQDYASTLQSDYAELLVIAEKNGTVDILDTEFERYRQGYKTRFMNFLRSHSRVVSMAIAGPSNFPVRQMQKRGECADARRNDLYEYRTKAYSCIRRKISPAAFISSSDVDAIEKLELKLCNLRSLQDRMKEANAAIRKYAKNGTDVQIVALIDLGYDLQQAQSILTPDCYGIIGFPSFALTNNNAKIKNTEQRITELTRKRQLPEVVKKNDETGVSIEIVPEENRVRVFFPGKPDSTVITKLKQYGFRWAPSQGAWSGYHNWRTVECAKSLIA